MRSIPLSSARSAGSELYGRPHVGQSAVVVLYRQRSVLTIEGGRAHGTRRHARVSMQLYPLKNASRSALTVSAWVVIMPCGKSL